MSDEVTLDYPQGKVAGAFDEESATRARAALVAGGFPPDQVESITAADVEGVETPLDKTGFKGLIDRFLLSLGDHQHQLEQLRRELEAGQTIVSVSVADDESKRRAIDILREQGSHHTKFFGRWAVETYV